MDCAASAGKPVFRSKYWGTGDSGEQPPERESSLRKTEPASRPLFEGGLHGTFDVWRVGPAFMVEATDIFTTSLCVTQNGPRISRGISETGIPPVEGGFGYQTMYPASSPPGIGRCGVRSKLQNEFCRGALENITPP